MSAKSRPLGPAFRALFVGSLVSNTGDGIRMAALPLLASELTSSPLVIGTVTAAQFLPWLSVAPIGGALVDRNDRRRTRWTLSGAFAVEGTAVAVTGLVSSSVWAVAAAWSVAGVPAGACIPVARSLQQRLVPDHLIGRVNVSSRMFTRGVIVIGALGAGAVADAVGLRTTFVLAGVVEILAGVAMAAALRGTARR